jgi:DNA-binding IclR family transcriptional regulator
MGSKTNTVQCLEKALHLLMELAKVQKDRDLSTLAQRTGLSKSTSSRLLSTMERHGIVRQNQVTQRFSLGPDMIRLGNIASDQLGVVELFHPYLEELMQNTGETASLAILQNDQALYIDQVQSQSMIRSFPPAGTRIDLHCSAVGKVLSCSLPFEQLQHILHEHELEAFTENTITNPFQLLKNIQQAEENGYAADLEEKEIGGICLAAPLRNHTGAIVAAIGISGPSNRITPQTIPSLTRRLVEIARKASSHLGYIGPQEGSPVPSIRSKTSLAKERRSR